MPKVLYKRDNEVKPDVGGFGLSPITKGVSYSRFQRHLNQQEEELMKRYKCGYSTLVKNLIAEKYQREFGKIFPSFL